MYCVCMSKTNKLSQETTSYQINQEHSGAQQCESMHVTTSEWLSSLLPGWLGFLFLTLGPGERLRRFRFLGVLCWGPHPYPPFPRAQAAVDRAQSVAK